ncbi:META domain-containing protein [Streptomyces noursei]|uniref:META domain-containing protein n=1 Tax=Streptomyces noursei TaxID=1971 RepID=UPI0033FA449B
MAGVAVACGGLSACGAAAGDTGGRNGGATASASPTKKGPGGLGGRLFDGIWTFFEFNLTVDGKEVHLPDATRPWVEFRDDGTIAGDYGCTPFRMKADLTATTLTLGEDLPPLPPPSATPAPTDETTVCPKPPSREKDDAGRELTDSEAQVRKFFHRGPLRLTEKKLQQEVGGPPPRTLPQLRNEHGDVATLTVVRSPSIFDTAFRLRQWMVGDSSDMVKSTKDTSFTFHRDGTVTGKLGCNDFTAEAVFNGSDVFFRAARLTTHRTCAAQNMQDERSILRILQRSLVYRYSGDSGGIYMMEQVDDYRATGLGFTRATDQ